MNDIEKLKKALHICRIQIYAAMRCNSLGLCKAVLKHAINDLKAMGVWGSD